MRTVAWDEEKHVLRMIDQRILPGKFEIIEFDDYRDVARGIKEMVVRGAPAIGAAAAFGLALAAFKSSADSVSGLRDDLERAAGVLERARPTAVNLSWALKRVLKNTEDVKGGVDALREAVLEEAQRIADEDVEINKRMAENGAKLIEDGDTIIHHCNTGALATVDWGTALGVIHTAHEQGKDIHVL
ncbi:MAG: S-methyl-5-thioribose-1-phosphate isomerase, partial [Anaerolineales bacterium]|nr:S-methyl-5-thioribose-1-phosphate isomerase [Anaerolineales bacterium]